ncbi:diaminopimelate epimerase [Anaerosporobacter sp.]
MKFTKMQGCGNDYVYINCFEDEIDITNPSELAKKLSDRRFGIGSDGLILIQRSHVASCRMDIYNSDGSRAEMCGNGIRCVAKYVYENGIERKTDFLIETLSGIKSVSLLVEDDRVKKVKVDMGSPFLEASQIPVISDKKVFIDELVVIDERSYYLTCVSMGNPHAVIFVDDLSKIDVKEIGEKIENHKLFPKRTNVEFIQVIDRSTIDMRVWERGSGETLACGTGACAAVVAGVLNERVSDEVTVRLLGGELEINYDRIANKVWMTGPAIRVFEGEFNPL